MILQIKLPCFSLFLLLIPVLGAYGQGETNSKSADVLEPNLKRLHALMSTTPAYQDDVMRLLLAEANLVAKDLLLQETLPIEATNLVAKYIPPPQLAQRMGAIGNLTTSNYTYYFSVGNKFSFLTQTRLERGYAELRKQYLWPMSQVNTNGAYQLAVKWLSEASMDVEALNRDCKIHILPFTPEGDKGQHFVPVYWVYWVKPEQEGRGSVASVELFLPTKTIRQLRVEDSKYILRKPLTIRNLDEIPSQTNTLKITNELDKP